MQNIYFKSKKTLIALNNKKPFITRIKIQKLNINLTLILVKIISKKTAKTKTSFLIVLYINLSNKLFYYSYNIY